MLQHSGTTRAVKLDHPALVRLIQRAYSAEKAAAFAYIGHAASLRDPAAKTAVKRIENDEWRHRENLHDLMQRYDVPPSRWYEIKFHIIGRVIAGSCHVIGRFMPFYFAGRLESGNVCEYFVMMQQFHSLGIRQHDEMLYEMGIKEKEHEVYFFEQVRASRLLPLFQRVFHWGAGESKNDVDLERKLAAVQSATYCRGYGRRQASDPSPSAGRVADDATSVKTNDRSRPGASVR
jgi:hypothetical protein